MTLRERLEEFVQNETYSYISLDRREAREILANAPEIIRDRDAYLAFVAFLRGLTGVQRVEDVVLAAGALLQDLGEEPS